MPPIAGTIWIGSVYPEMEFDGDHVVTQTEWIRQQVADRGALDPQLEETIQNRFVDAQSRPWTSDEFPEAAAWLDANEESLQLVIDASGPTTILQPVDRRRRSAADQHAAPAAAVFANSLTGC